MNESNYLIFEEHIIAGHKLPIYTVKNKQSSVMLGTIKFYGAWRKFVFEPSEAVIFDASCLNDIITFLNNKTTDWRNSLNTNRRKGN